MARSRQKYRRSTSRSAASLLALALPAPLQRLANSQVGPLLMFFGVPAMLVVGLLQIDWQNGTPHLKVNPEKASALRDAVEGQLGNLENQPIVQQWEQTAQDAWRAHRQSAQQPYPQQQPYPSQQQPYPSQQQQPYWSQQYPARQGSGESNYAPSGWAPSQQPENYSGRSTNGSTWGTASAPFPSTRASSSPYTSAQPSVPQSAAMPSYDYSSSQRPYQPTQYSQQQYAPQQNAPQQYAQPGYSQQPYQQQLDRRPQQSGPPPSPSSAQSWQTQSRW